jgi:hypothetical protein
MASTEWVTSHLPGLSTTARSLGCCVGCSVNLPVRGRQSSPPGHQGRVERVVIASELAAGEPAPRTRCSLLDERVLGVGKLLGALFCSGAGS